MNKLFPILFLLISSVLSAFEVELKIKSSGSGISLIPDSVIVTNTSEGAVRVFTNTTKVDLSIVSNIEDIKDNGSSKIKSLRYIEGAIELLYFSDLNQSYTIYLYNSIGELVAGKNQEMTKGLNELYIASNRSLNGMFLLSMNNGQSPDNYKLLIHENQLGIFPHPFSGFNESIIQTASLPIYDIRIVKTGYEELEIIGYQTQDDDILNLLLNPMFDTYFKSAFFQLEGITMKGTDKFEWTEDGRRNNRYDEVFHTFKKQTDIVHGENRRLEALCVDFFNNYQEPIEERKCLSNVIISPDTVQFCDISCNDIRQEHKKYKYQRLTVILDEENKIIKSINFDFSSGDYETYYPAFRREIFDFWVFISEIPYTERGDTIVANVKGKEISNYLRSMDWDRVDSGADYMPPHDMQSHEIRYFKRESISPSAVLRFELVRNK